MKRLLLCGTLLLAFCSCHRQAFEDKAKMELLADRTCRAISIRKERFAAADQIRFANDTLLHTKSKTDSARLQQRLAGLLKQKAILLKESLALADTIRLQLDSLMPYTDKDAQQRFTSSLNSLLAKKGCDNRN